MWLSDPGKHGFRRFPEIITGSLKWAAEVHTIKHGVGTQVTVILSFELIYTLEPDFQKPVFRVRAPSLHPTQFSDLKYLWSQALPDGPAWGSAWVC